VGLLFIGAAVLVFIMCKPKPAPAPVPAAKTPRGKFHAEFLEKAKNVDWRGINPLMALAVADMETGFGNGGVFKKTNNLFSMTKGSWWAGPVYKVPSNGLEFRKYDTWEASMRDFVALMHRPYYSRALSHALAGDFPKFALTLKALGYDASEPRYAQLLIERYEIINVKGV
jgi:flagellum-specific peptidoglycan hydrolase FlgJ